MTSDEAGTDAGAGAAAAGPSPGTHGDGWRERRRRTDRVNVPLAVTIMVGLAGGLLLADLVGGAVSKLDGLLVTLIVSLFLSFAMEPAVQWLSNQGMRRGLGTFLVFLGALLLIVGFVAAMLPLIVDQIRNLADAGPAVLGDLAGQARNLPGDIGPPIADWLEEQRSELPSRVPDMAGRLATGAAGVGSTLAGVTIQFLTMLLVTFYLVADGPRLRRTLVGRLRPENQREFLQVWELAIAKTGGYVYSRLLTAVASTIFHIVVFTLVGLPYAAALGVWVGIISSLIPVVGTYIAGALPLLIALAADPLDAVWVLVAIVVYQQLENYLIAPRITAATMELHPAIAFVSVLVGGALLGAPGALLALPATAIVAALASAYGERHEVMDHGLVSRDERPRP